MEKILLNSKDDFEKYINRQNPNNELIENDELEPSNYPCILVEHYNEEYYYEDIDGYIYYTFIYLKDFTNEE